jgi:hypothetical protein
MLPKNVPDKEAQRVQSQIPGEVKYRPPQGDEDERSLDKIRPRKTAEDA